MESCTDIYGDKWDIRTRPYLPNAVVVPTIICFQSSLLFHSLYHEIKHHHNKESQKIFLQQRILYIVLQLTGLYWTILDLFRFVILPTRINCNAIEAYSPKILPILYYLIYLYQIFLRLNTSFKGSYLELSKRNLYILGGFVNIPIIIGNIIFFTITRDTRPCVATWKPADFQFDDDLQYCIFPVVVLNYSGEMDGASALAFIFLFAWIPAMNLLIGVIFSIKLNKLLSHHEANGDINFEYRSLIIKNSILSLLGSISTLVTYALGFTIDFIFLYLDVFLNCLVIGLMFKYNNKWYKICCKCFIVLCFIIYDKSKNKAKQDILRHMNSIQLNVRAVGDDDDKLDHGASVEVEDNKPNVKSCE